MDTAFSKYGEILERAAYHLRDSEIGRGLYKIFKFQKTKITLRSRSDKMASSEQTALWSIRANAQPILSQAAKPAFCTNILGKFDR